MLKVEPHFKLDRTFRGPYCVGGVTSTNVAVNDPTAESWNVSIQRVSRCNEALLAASPWYGHGGKKTGRGIRYTSQEDLRLRAQSKWII